MQVGPGFHPSLGFAEFVTKPLKYVGINPCNRTQLYYSTVKRCRECSQKSRCTRGKFRTLVHPPTPEPARQHADPWPEETKEQNNQETSRDKKRVLNRDFSTDTPVFINYRRCLKMLRVAELFEAEVPK